MNGNFLDVDSFVLNRRGLSVALDLYLNGYNVVLIAPTGYGKTILSIKLFKEGLREGVTAGLIHVAPYRALVREIFSKKFKPFYTESGWQMHGDLEYADKSPFFLRGLVVTTLDSFVYNLYRIPVAEMRKIVAGKTQGHYYPVLASIFTSTIVFDEAHFYLDDSLSGGDESLRALIAALDYLSYMKVPMVVETATMSSELIADLIDVMERGRQKTFVVYVGDRNTNQATNLQSMLGEKVIFQQDPEFTVANSFNWLTEVIDEQRSFEIAKDLCDSKPVLFVRNTVKRAVDTYDELKNSCTPIVLIHGLMSHSHKQDAIRRAEDVMKTGKGVIISTQVIEAGVEIGTSTLITDAAPIENVAQRAGRLCRESQRRFLEECNQEGARVYIVKNQFTAPYDEDRVVSAINVIKRVLESGRQVDWRLLEKRENYISVADLIESAKSAKTSSPKTRGHSVYSIYLKSDAGPGELIEIMRSYDLRLLDRGYLVSVAVPREQLVVEKIRHGLELDGMHNLANYFEIVSVDAERLFIHEYKHEDRRCLLYENGKPILLLITHDRRGVKLLSLPCKNSLNKIVKYLRSNKSLEFAELLEPGWTWKDKDMTVSDVFLLGRHDCYDRERGLRIWE